MGLRKGQPYNFHTYRKNKYEISTNRKIMFIECVLK